MEDKIQSNSFSLFTDEQLFCLEKTTPLIKNTKLPICRLDFSCSTKNLVQRKGVPVEINKVREITKFTPLINHIRRKDILNSKHSHKHIPSWGKYSETKSSPIQKFNTFSENLAAFFAENNGTVTGCESLEESERKVMSRNVCCNCKKSQCLKLYCECFRNKTYCQGCSCRDCLNIKENQAIRDEAIQSTLLRNPTAFDPKISLTRDSRTSTEVQHTRGCHCKESKCLKNYCECFQSGAFCSSLCKCDQCKNIKGEKNSGLDKDKMAGKEEKKGKEVLLTVHKRARPEKLRRRQKRKIKEEGNKKVRSI